MLNLPTKPRITAEVTRGDYEITFKLRVRRSWRNMTLDERRAALIEGATQLDEYARQMREEAEIICDGAVKFDRRNPRTERRRARDVQDAPELAHLS